MANPQSAIHNPQSPVLSLWVTGGGYVTAAGYGRRGEGRPMALPLGDPIIPKGKDIFERPLSRYGRFDRYTRMGCAAVALALRDAGLDHATEKRNIGIVSSSLFECAETDAAYYETTRDQDGALASPNLFSYTLPGIVHGECAVHFLLAGPTLAVGEPPARPSRPFRPGLPALLNAARLMQAGKSEIMLAGWIESPPAPVHSESASSSLPSGALFVVLETRVRESPGDGNTGPPLPLVFHQGILKGPGGKPVESLLDLFPES